MKQNIAPYLSEIKNKHNAREKPSCISDEMTLNYKDFIKYVRPYNHIRVGVDGSKEPFRYVYFKINKKELINTVRMNNYDVTFSVMVNPNIENDIGVLYISKMKMMLKFD